jgi:hypothetical protein
MIIDIVLYCFNADEAHGDLSAAEFAEEYPRVLAEAARLITLLCTKYSCDAHFFAFARSQLRSFVETTEALFQLEHREFAEDLKQKDRIAADGPLQDSEEIHDKIREKQSHHRFALGLAVKNALDTGAFTATREQKAAALHAEAAEVARWSVLVLLARRNDNFAKELFSGGLPEMLFACVLDSSRPVVMAAAWKELKILQLRHESVQRLCWLVFGRHVLVEALSVELFYEAATPADIEKARFALRNLRFAREFSNSKSVGGNTVGADELELQQSLCEVEMQLAFPEDTEHEIVSTDQTAPVPKGKEKRSRRRVVERGPLKLHGDSVYALEQPPPEEIPFVASLGDICHDPLDERDGPTLPVYRLSSSAKAKAQRRVDRSMGISTDSIESTRWLASRSLLSSTHSFRNSIQGPPLTDRTHDRAHERALALSTSLELKPSARIDAQPDLSYLDDFPSYDVDKKKMEMPNLSDLMPTLSTATGDEPTQDDGAALSSFIDTTAWHPGEFPQQSVSVMSGLDGGLSVGEGLDLSASRDEPPNQSFFEFTTLQYESREWYEYTDGRPDTSGTALPERALLVASKPSTAPNATRPTTRDLVPGLLQDLAQIEFPSRPQTKGASRPTTMQGSRPGTMQRSRQSKDSVEASRPATMHGSRYSLLRDASRPGTTQGPGRKLIVASRAPADLPWRTSALDKFPHHPSWKTAEQLPATKLGRLDAKARAVLPPGWAYREPDQAVQIRPRPLKKPPAGRMHKGVAGRAMPAWADWIETKPERRKVSTFGQAVDRVYAEEMVKGAGRAPMKPPPPPPPEPKAPEGKWDTLRQRYREAVKAEGPSEEVAAATVPVEAD